MNVIAIQFIKDNGEYKHDNISRYLSEKLWIVMLKEKTLGLCGLGSFSTSPILC